MSKQLLKFTVGSAPHWRTKTSISRMNYAFILALIPTAFAGVIAHSFGSNAQTLNAAFGSVGAITKTLVIEMGLDSGVLWFFGIFGIIALGAGTGILVEYISQVAMRQPYRATDGHGALIGLIMALLMPPTAPWWVLIVGVIIAIFLGKQVFGGIGDYPLHPAMIGWLILLLSWPGYLYPIGTASIAAAHPAVVVATAAGGLGLALTGYIPLRIPLGILASVVIFSLLFSTKLDGGLQAQLLSGHVVLAAFFLATDSTSSPANRMAGWIYAVVLGFLIVLIRVYGIWPDAVPFAVLLANILSPLLDRLRPRVKQVAF